MPTLLNTELHNHAILVARASELEMPALALTDRDGLAGAIRFTKACVSHMASHPSSALIWQFVIGDTSGALPRVTVLSTWRWWMALFSAPL